MKIVQVFQNKVYYILEGYDSLSDARCCFDSNTILEEASDEVQVGWDFHEDAVGDARFTRPMEPGKIYDENLGSLVDAEEYRSNERVSLHESTTDDTLQALRKIREGDTSIDWELWLKALDDYNVAIEDTKNQKDYPLKVVYPEYPTKPTK